MADSYYLILGLPPNTPQDDIKKAYRQAALEYHPDGVRTALCRMPESQSQNDNGGELAVRKFLSRVDSKVVRASEDKKKQDRRTQAASKIALAAANALAKQEKRQRKRQEQEKFR